MTDEIVQCNGCPGEISLAPLREGEVKRKIERMGFRASRFSGEETLGLSDHLIRMMAIVSAIVVIEDLWVGVRVD